MIKLQTIHRTGSRFGADSWGALPVIAPSMAVVSLGGPRGTRSGTSATFTQRADADWSMWGAPLPDGAPIVSTARLLTGGCGAGCGCAPCSFNTRGEFASAVDDIEAMAIESAKPRAMSPLQVAGIAALVLWLLK